MITHQQIEDWNKLSKLLAETKAAEMSLRKEICNEVFDGREGKFKIDKKIGKFVIRAKSCIKQKLDKDALECIYDDLSHAAKRCIEYKPSLVAKELKILDESDILFEIIDESPAAPKLELISTIDTEESPFK